MNGPDRAGGTVLVVGDLVADLLVRSEGIPEPATDVPGRIRLAPGGAAANQAVWLARLGRPVRFAGRVGSDLLGDFLIDDLQRQGVEAHVERDRRQPTGTVLVWILPGGERAMVTSRGANAFLTARQVQEDLWAGVAHLVLTGYAFAAPGSRPTACRLLAEARRRGVSPEAAAYANACAARLVGLEGARPPLDLPAWPGG